MPPMIPRRVTLPLLVILLSLLVSCGGGGGGGDGGGFTKADYQFLYTYNAVNLDGHTIRWPSLPIGVSSGGVPGVPVAFDRWNSATGGAVGFNYAGNSITVAYSDTTSYCGVTTIRWSSAGRILSAKVSVARDQSGCLGGLSDTLTHEAGHALGFLGHDASGLMNPQGGQPISDQESRFMRLLYSLAPGTDISDKLAKSRTSGASYDKSGTRVHSMTINRSK
ncbi:hypothetical protein [Desulfoferula mesophila]|uniref:Peptidase metallopeptidase domain-containing protein n=1 Tax=Desulfoferula mesophila TaxID=3058419 RepID=A0AAU9EJ58_9BACT|nr:hypothetical protein FAK_10870 [Desulfoferula mesophilus]